MSAVPELRFPEFRSEWESKKLSSYLKVSPHKNRTEEFDRNDVLSVSGEYGVVNQIEFLGRSYAGVSLAEYKILRHGEIVYTKSPLASNPYGIIKANLGNDGIVSTLYAVYTTTAQASPEFIDRYFENDDHMNRYIRPLVNKGAKNDMKIPNERVLIDPVRFPALQEQNKIVKFLSAVDEKLAAIEVQLVGWRSFKRGMMQALFSQSLRFKTDDGSEFPDWKETELSKLAKFEKGRGISKSDISENGTAPCIRYGELYTTYGNVIEEVISMTDYPPNNPIMSSGNDVIIPSSGETAEDIATASAVLVKNVILGGDLNVIRTEENAHFLAALLSNKYRIELAKLAQGNSVVHLYSKDMKGLRIEIPSLPEQQKIADALSAIDTKIDALTGRLEATREFKRGLLQKMFV